MRNPRFIGFVGSPGSGKSTYIANAIKVYKRNVIVFKHVINIDDPAFSFLPENTIEQYEKSKNKINNKLKIAGTEEDYKDFLNWIKNNYRNGLLIIDDCTIFEDNKLSQLMKHLVAMRRHYGLDIWLVYHGFSAFPIDQYKFLNYLVIFNCNDSIKYKKTKIPQFEDIEIAMLKSKNRFNTLPKTNPKRYLPETVTLSL